MIKNFKDIGKFRDSLLVFVAVLYTAGYIVWSIHAFRNDLGFLPAIDLQYFVAGLVPFVLGLTFYWAVTIGAKLFEKFKEPLNKNATGKFKIYRRVIVLLVIISGILLALSDKLKAWLNIDIDVITGLIFIISLLLMPQDYFNNTFRPERPAEFFKETISQKVSKWLLTAFYHYFVGVIVLLVFIIYLFDWYPKIPQEMGGVKPKLAVIDAEKNSFSSATQQILFAFPNDTAAILQTRPVTVYYFSSDKIIFKTELHDLFELQPGEIKSIHWLVGGNTESTSMVYINNSPDTATAKMLVNKFLKNKDTIQNQ